MSQGREPFGEQDSAELEKVTTAVDSKEDAHREAALAEFGDLMRSEIGDSKEKADCEAALINFGNYLRSESVRDRYDEILVNAFVRFVESYKKSGGKSTKNPSFWRNVVLQTKTPTCDDGVTNTKGRSI